VVHLPHDLRSVGLGQADAVQLFADDGGEVLLEQAGIQPVDAHVEQIARLRHRLEGLGHLGPRPHLLG